MRTDFPLVGGVDGEENDLEAGERGGLLGRKAAGAKRVVYASGERRSVRWAVGVGQRRHVVGGGCG